MTRSDMMHWTLRESRGIALLSRSVQCIMSDRVIGIFIVLEHLDRLDRAVPLLWRIGRRHPHGELTETRRDLLQRAFLETLAERLGSEVTPETNAAWLRVFDFVSDALRRAAVQANAR